jgi:hypothetical protein
LGYFFLDLEAEGIVFLAMLALDDSVLWQLLDFAMESLLL